MPASLLLLGALIAAAATSPPAVAAVSTADRPPVPGAVAITDDDGTGLDSPGNGLGLAPGPAGDRSGNPAPHPFVPIGGAGLGGVALAGAVLSRRRTRGGARGGGTPIFVYVPGHGGATDGFDDLAGRMGVGAEDVRVFDYRWAWPSSDPVEASRRAPTGDAADALGAYLAALAEDGRPIYLVGHSKGGAVITEVVGRWDEHPEIGVDAVGGAAILDPPIAAGPLGFLQSVGWLHGPTADDGMFDPIRCGWNGCRDVRDGLGERSGVEVMIIRNPDARFTNFWGRPDGVRVYDLDDGSGDMLGRFPDVLGMWRRMGDAHNSVLHSDVVADCISAEATDAGSCEWPVPAARTPAWGRGRSGPGPVMR